MTGRVQTLHFGAAGTQRVTGTAVHFKTAGTRWAALRLISPRAALSNKATYTLACSRSPVTVSARGAVSPVTRTVTCGAARPSVTFTGTIRDAKAGKVDYYWELPTGNGPVRSLTFSAPGTKAVVPAKVTAATDITRESGTLVVLHPAAVASNTATFSVSCTQPASPPRLTVNLIASQPSPKTVLCGSAPPGYEVMATVTSNEVLTGETYHWVRPNGTSTAPGTMNVASPDSSATGQFDSSTSDSFTPSSDNFSGTETLVFTSPVQGSWSIPFTLDCSATPATAPPPTRQPLAVVPPGGNDFEAGTVGEPFSATMTAANGPGPYTWSATGLPPGLAIDAATGTISGTPTVAGGYSPQVTVTDSESPPQSASQRFSFDIRFAPIVMSAPPLPGGTVGAAYPDVTFSATGGDGYYSWYAAPDTTLPAGLSLSASGVLSGTPTAAGTFTIYVDVDDPASNFASATLTLVINPASLPSEDLSEAGPPLVPRLTSCPTSAPA